MNTFVVYESYGEALAELSDADRLQVYDALFHYGLNGEEPELSGVPKAIFALMKPAIDTNNRKRSGGKKGGRPKKEENDPQEETSPEEKENHRFPDTETIGSENKKPKVSKKGAKKKPSIRMKNEEWRMKNEEWRMKNEEWRMVDASHQQGPDGLETPPAPDPQSDFSPPSLDAIRQYCQERSSPVDPETFFDYYEANGWMVGKNPIKNWQAVLRGWERKDQSSPGKQKTGGLPDWYADMGDQSEPSADALAEIDALKQKVRNA